MYLTALTTDCNGFCLFDPTILKQALAREPAEGENLFRMFQSSELGDEVLRLGAVVPIYPITDSLYTLCIRTAKSAFPAERLHAQARARTGVYPLHVHSRLVLADLAVLQEWSPELAWRDVPFRPGFYSVVIAAHHGEPAGFDVLLTPEAQLPELTATFDTNLDIITMQPAP